MKFSLMFFASSEDGRRGDKYRLVLASARWADREDFDSIWVPERHFNPFGSLYPNPSVLQAALSRETKRVGLRAGSLVMPLHHPLRVVEEWSMVDNLSGGRVGISFAPGWNPTDFAFFPERYQNRYESLYQGMQDVRAIWSSRKATVTSGDGRQVEVSVFPEPVQPELPVWVTAAGNPDSFAKAGSLGANLLTHLLDQGIVKLREKIGIYRLARANAGFDPGQVTLMLHTFVGEDLAQVHEHVRAPYCDYLKRNLGLLRGLAYSRGRQVDLQALSPEDLDQMVGFLYDRFASERGLIGTPQTCLPLLRDLAAVGVDEVACLLDFGPEDALVLSHLPHLKRLAQAYLAQPVRPARSTALPAQPRPATARRLVEARAACSRELSAEERVALDLGADGDCVEALFTGNWQALGLVRRPAGDATGLHLNPDYLELCTRIFMAALPPELRRSHREAPFVPAAIGKVALRGALEERVWSHARVDRRPGGLELRVEVFSHEERTLVVMEGVLLRQIRPAPLTEMQAADHLYDLEWSAAPSVSTSQRAAGVWLILADSRLGESLGQAIDAHGGTTYLVFSGDEFERHDGRSFRVRPGQRADLERCFREIGRDRIEAVVHLWSLDAPPAPGENEAFERGQILAAASLPALCQAAAGLQASLWLVTEQAQVTGRELTPVSYPATPMWGAGRVISVEQPELWGGMIDLERDTEPGQAIRQLMEGLFAGGDEDHVAFRQDRRLMARLIPVRLQERPPAATIRESITYLITGGLGDLGLVLANALVDAGARSLFLLGHKPLRPNDRDRERQRAIEALRKRGCRVFVDAADVGDGKALRAALQRFRKSGEVSIGGVFHLAAVVKGAPLTQMDAATWEAAFHAKARGAWQLHRAFAEQSLDWFVLYSAIPGLLGHAGFGAANYAAANALLDGLAAWRHATGRPGLSIGWGPWNRVGMAARADALALLSQQGLGSFSPEEGVRLLPRLLGSNRAYIAAAAIQWRQLFSAFPGARQAPLLASMAQPVAEGAPASAQAQALSHASESDRLYLIQTYLLNQLRTIATVPISEANLDDSFTDLGMDSLAAIALRNRIVADFGLDFPIVALLENPTIGGLATTILDRWSRATLPAEQPREEHEEWLVGEL